MRPFVVLLCNHSWQKAVCSGAASHAHTDARTGPDPKPIFQNLILQTTGQLPHPLRITAHQTLPILSPSLLGNFLRNLFLSPRE